MGTISPSADGSLGLFLATDKRSKIQNEAMYTLSHMSKHLLTAIGDVDNPALLVANSSGNTTYIQATIDSNLDGVRNASDGTVTYCFNNATCNGAAQPYTVVFVPMAPGSAEILAKHVRSFQVVQNVNFLNMSITTCWNPSGTPQACGTMDNPAMNMSNIIRMPSVSSQ